MAAGVGLALKAKLKRRAIEHTRHLLEVRRSNRRPASLPSVHRISAHAKPPRHFADFEP